MELAGFSIIQPQVSAWVGRVLNLHLISTHITTWEKCSILMEHINAAIEYIPVVQSKWTNNNNRFLVLCGRCGILKLKLSRIQRRGPDWHWPLSPGKKGKGWVVRWWFHIFFLMFTPQIGEDESILILIFFKGVGWNHQLDFSDWLFCDGVFGCTQIPALGEFQGTDVEVLSWECRKRAPGPWFREGENHGGESPSDQRTPTSLLRCFFFLRPNGSCLDLTATNLHDFHGCEIET